MARKKQLQFKVGDYVQLVDKNVYKMSKQKSGSCFIEGIVKITEKDEDHYFSYKIKASTEAKGPYGSYSFNRDGLWVTKEQVIKLNKLGRLLYGS